MCCHFYLSTKDRTCELCQSNEIEDEIHFICRCNFLSVKCTALFNSISEMFDKFTYIFNEVQTTTVFKIHMGSILLKKKLII